MAKESTNTRTEIIQAAREQFLRHGYEGARLQKIADHIGVTKAMIHYYFNTKKELFERVYKQSADQIFGGLADVLDQDVPLFKKIEQLVEVCLQVADRHPQVLSFVVTESNRKSDWLNPILEENGGLDLEAFEKELQDAADNYQIASVDARTLLIQIFSLCYYPVISHSINKSLLAESGPTENGISMTTPKGVVLDTILNWLTA